MTLAPIDALSSPSLLRQKNVDFSKQIHVYDTAEVIRSHTTSVNPTFVEE
jgi:hypothetical protein